MPRPLSDETGSMVVEATILIPIAMILVLFVVQACIWAHAATLVQDAAAQGDEVATVYGGTPSSGVGAAESLLAATARNVVIQPDIEVTRLPGDVLQLRVSGAAESILPGLRLPVSAVRIGVIQEFRESG